MKQFLTLTVLFISSFGFSQDSGIIIGKVTDKEVKDAPIIFAHIVVKDSAITLNSDISGAFLIENLSDGKHTLVCTYPGYESKEIEIEIVSGEPTEVEIALNARKLSLPTTVSVSSTSSSIEGR